MRRPIYRVALAVFSLAALLCPRAWARASEDESLTIYYEENAQVELISPAGVRVLIDVAHPNQLSAPPTADDLLLTTHNHSDHYSRSFVNSFPGAQLTLQAGELERADVHILSIPSAHLPTDPLLEKDGSNYIFIIDIGGLRVVHFGDIGQDELLPEQLEALGAVDIAITQFENSYSQMDMKNRKGFNLMDQVQPRLIIPTHTSYDALAIAAEKWEGFQNREWPITVDRSMLVEGQTRFLAVGIYARMAVKLYNFPAWDTAAGAVTLYYEDNAQVELISPAGVRVLFDVWNPALLSAPPTADDILLTTHAHPDHYSQAFVDSFPGEKITAQTGEISRDDIHILSIPSAHTPTKTLKDKGASNYLLIVDVAGLRLVHFGDIGQDELLPEQLEALGAVDIAITQFVNSYSLMSLDNMKGFNLMDQVQPRLIIPTHFSLDALSIAADKWEGFQAQEWPITVDGSMLAEGQTRFLAVGVYAPAAVNLFHFPAWSAAAGAQAEAE